MKTFKIAIFIVLCLVISGCQQSEIDELNSKILEQDQNAIKLSNKIDELNSKIENLEKENVALNQIIADHNKSKHPIEIEFEAEMESWNGNTWEGVNILSRYGDKWKEEMEKYYELLYEELNDDKKKWLVSSQEQWLIFTKENEELDWQVNDQLHHGGTIMHIVTADIYYERYRQRALELKQNYEMLSYEY